MRPATLAGLVVLVAALLVPPVAADVLHLKDGRTLEGEIVGEDETGVDIKMPLGVLRVSRDDIARIELKISPEAQYRKTLAALDPEDWQGHADLADWCRENGLPSFARELDGKSRRLRYEVGLKRIDQNDADGFVAFAQTLKREGWSSQEVETILELALLADPDHREARRMLGYTLFEGRWLTGAQIEEIEEIRHARAMRAKGYVQYKGEWMPPDSKLLQEELDRVVAREHQVAAKEREVAARDERVQAREREVEKLVERVNDLADDLKTREADLTRRWDELRDREQAVAAREAYVQSRLDLIWYLEAQIQSARQRLLNMSCGKCGTTVPAPNIPALPKSDRKFYPPK